MATHSSGVYPGRLSCFAHSGLSHEASAYSCLGRPPALSGFPGSADRGAASWLFLSVSSAFFTGFWINRAGNQCSSLTGPSGKWLSACLEVTFDLQVMGKFQSSSGSEGQ